MLVWSDPYVLTATFAGQCNRVPVSRALCCFPQPVLLNPEQCPLTLEASLPLSHMRVPAGITARPAWEASPSPPCLSGWRVALSGVVSELGRAGNCWVRGVQKPQALSQMWTSTGDENSTDCGPGAWCRLPEAGWCCASRRLISVFRSPIMAEALVTAEPIKCNYDALSRSV